MKRILAKGAKLRDIQHENVRWSDYANITDYELVFLNLDSIVENRDDLATPDSNIPISIDFPSPEKVGELLAAGNKLFVGLPRTRHVEMNHIPSDGENKTQRVDLLSWLPFSIKTTEERGTSVKESSIDNQWKWYFDEDFDWPMYFESIHSEKDKLPYLRLFNMVNERPLARNVANQDLALCLNIITGADVTSSMMDKDNDINESYPGNLYLIPLKPNVEFSNFASGVLYHLYDEPVEPRIKEEPDWINEYQLSRQKEIIKQVSDLKSEFYRLDDFKTLLYGTGSGLEEIVTRSFRELGFNVDNETPAEEDGKIIFDDCVVVFEVHGTTGPIGRRKCDQLSRWVRSQKEENPHVGVQGLLIGNPYRNTYPEDRRKPLAENARRSLNQDDNMFLSTTTLYKLLSRFENNKVSFEEIRDILRSEQTDVQLEVD